MKMLSEITKDAMELPTRQRFTLARILLDVSEEQTPFDPDVDAAWEDEICRRIKSIEDGKAESRSATEVFAELDRRFPG